MIPSGASERAAGKEGYIGDKGHEVKPSLIRKAAIDCSLLLMHRISRRLGGARLALEPLQPKHARANACFKVSSNRRSRIAAVHG